jgi:hypothetical protein
VSTEHAVDQPGFLRRLDLRVEKSRSGDAFWYDVESTCVRDHQRYAAVGCDTEKKRLVVAHLFAAAPDLLRAVESLLPFVEDEVRRGQVPGEDTSDYEDACAVAAAKKALEKAFAGVVLLNERH